MAPTGEARKRKTTSEAGSVTGSSSSKRLRSSRHQEPGDAGSSSSSSQTPQPHLETAGSGSPLLSTPKTSQLAVSPLASSSVAGDQYANNSTSEVDPSSSSSMHSPISSISDVPPWDPQYDVSTLLARPASDNTPSFLRNVRAFRERPAVRARLSEQWRNATREDVSGGAQTTTSSTNMPGQALTGIAKPFLDLPRELRDQIYRELYVHDGAIAIRQPKFHLPVLAHPSKPMAFMRTNSQIFAEASAVYIAENNFILDLNILTAIDFLAAMPRTLSQHFTSITLGKAIMSGYVRYELGMFDSSRLRTDLVKRLVYEWNLKTISIEVPDEHNPNPSPNNNLNTIATAGNAANGAGGMAAATQPNTWFNLSTFHPRHDYSWSLMRELVDVLLESGFNGLRLVYESPFPPHLDVHSNPWKLIELYALSRILYLDDEYEVETQVKRIEMARLAGRRGEFADKKAVEKFVRGRRAIRRMGVAVGKKKAWEKGEVILLRRPVPSTGGEAPRKGMFKIYDTTVLMKGPREKLKLCYPGYGGET